MEKKLDSIITRLDNLDKEVRYIKDRTEHIEINDLTTIIHKLDDLWENTKNLNSPKPKSKVARELFPDDSRKKIPSEPIKRKQFTSKPAKPSKPNSKDEFGLPSFSDKLVIPDSDEEMGLDDQ